MYLMQDKNQINCNCMTPFYHASEKLFLSRKDKIQELDLTFFNRRMNKNPQIKSQSQNKSHKKSLKKRSGSQHPTEVPPVYLCNDETYRNQDECNIQPQNYDHLQHSIPANRINNPKFKAQMKSQNTKWTKKPDIYLNPNLNYQIFDSKGIPFIQQNSCKNIYSLNNQEISYSNQLKRQPPQNMFKKHNFQSQKTITKNETSLLKIPVETKKDRLTIQINQASTNKDTNNQIHSAKTLKFKYLQSKILQNNQFNNFVLHQNQPNEATTNQQTKSFKRPREMKKQGKLAKLLEVRMAQSEDQSQQESVSSEVIGKGFDRNYQQIDDLDETLRFAETLATRSTNTKASEMTKRASLNGTPATGKLITNLFQSARLI